MDLSTATPVEIDTRLADNVGEDMKLTEGISRAMTDLRVALGQRQERAASPVDGRVKYYWPVDAYETEREAVELIRAAEDGAYVRNEVPAAYNELHRLRQRVLVLRRERVLIDAEYNRRGGWTRAWAVPGGHIHNTRSCHTCFPTTKFGWLPEVSGMDEAEIVDLAGERACTVCYPSAPVNVLKQACRLWTAEETRDAQAMADRAAELAAKRDAKAAKAITAADGSPLRDDSGYVIKTEVTAEREAVDHLHNHFAYDYELKRNWVKYVVEALAAKRGSTFHEQMELVSGKAQKKAAKTKREMAQMGETS